MAEPLGISGVKFRLLPTEAQAQTLARWMGCERVIYNAKVDEDQYFWSFKRKALALTGLFSPIDASYARFKNADLTPWLSEVPSQISRNGANKWVDAKWRAMRGEAGQPVRKRRGGRQSVLLTRELWQLLPLSKGDMAPKGACNAHRLFIGTKKFPVGFVEFHAHREYRMPKQIVVSRDADGWWVSFNFAPMAEDWQKPEAERPWWAKNVAPDLRRSQQELLYELALLSEEELASKTLGIDRGVINPASDSRGVFYAPDPVCVERIKRKEIGKKRHQRKLARQQKGSANSRKTKRKIAKNEAYGRHVRKDYVEKSTTRIADDDTVRVVALEDLNTRAMTRRPKPKKDEKTGQFKRNGAAAKAGLNRGILAACWGEFETRLGQKLDVRNKVLVKVSAYQSSQECSDCGHTHASNRPSQAVFQCNACNHHEHADLNAPKVIGKRGVRDILSGKARAEALAEAAETQAKKAKRGKKQERQQVASEEAAGDAGPGRSGVSVERAGGLWAGIGAPKTDAMKQKKKAGLREDAMAGSSVL